jgi:UDP-N-acetylglucosamine 2-epimerase (non-hydrolysing)
VQGDTNSTLAGALAATKLGQSVAHIEAGLRSFDRSMPEEINRVVVDHVADHLFAPTDEMAALLRDEGIPESRIAVTGNRDVAAETSTVLDDLALEADDFALLTAHRAETVDDRDNFQRILNSVGVAGSQLGLEVVYPIHPRAADRLAAFDLDVPDCVRPIDPLGFFDFLRLEDAAALAFTDSGGVQEETCILGTPCVTLRYGTERPETVHVGSNCIAGHDGIDVLAAAIKMYGKDPDWAVPYGDGRAAVHILDAVPFSRVERAAQRAE